MAAALRALVTAWALATLLYSGSNEAAGVAWYSRNALQATHPVGAKGANELGLHDMSGNVAEWCLDWYDAGCYARSPTTDPVNLAAASYRVVRGGSWTGALRRLPGAARNWFKPDRKSDYVGFRVCLAPTLAM